MRDFMSMDGAAREAFLRACRIGNEMSKMANVSEKPKGAVALHPLVHRTSPHGQPFVGACGACGKEGITFDMLTTDACSNPRRLSNEQAVMAGDRPDEAGTVEKPDDVER